MNRFWLPAILIVLGALWMGCSDDSDGPCGCEESRWPLEGDSMNLAVLVSDYTSYVFERGALNYYRLCDGCDQAGLPFTVTLDSPDDLGSVLFEYEETGDTLFYGTLIWMGRGRIGYPRVFFDSGQFERVGKPSRAPLGVEYFNIIPTLDQSEFEEKADSAWAAVQTLDLVAEFAKNPYRVGIYMYAPVLGVFDPGAAKWVVFVYRGKT